VTAGCIYEASVERILDDLTHTMQRLLVRGRMPGGTHVGAIAKCHIEAVALLHVYLPCGPLVAKRRLLGTDEIGNFCLTRSSVLTLHDVVVGALVVQCDPRPDVVFIYGVVMALSMRRTWATARLKYDAIRRLAAFGIKTVRFDARSRDTLRHAARIDARPVV